MIESCHDRFCGKKRRKICILCILTITNCVTLFRALSLCKIPQNSSVFTKKKIEKSELNVQIVLEIQNWNLCTKILKINWKMPKMCKFGLFLRSNKNSRQRKVVNKTLVKIRKNPKFTWISKCIESNIDSKLQDYQKSYPK